MAVAPRFLAFPGSSSAHIYNGAGNGEMNLFSSIHKQAESIDQCQNGEDFHSEIDRVLKILSRTSQTKIMGSMASRPRSTPDVDVDIEFSRFDDQSEVPVLTCDGEGDGGHRCPYFPCPYCHRSRSIFIPESNTTLITCEEDEVYHQETPFVISSNVANDIVILFNRSVNALSLPGVSCDEGDGGHRCPYFPCPYCHRSRNLFIPKIDYNFGSTNLDCKSNLDAFCHGHADYHLMSRIDDQNSVPVLTCPDKGHTCPYFPCPICHRTR